MLRVVFLQLVVGILAGAISGLVGGVASFLSALLGALCCVVPNGLFALRLFVHNSRERFVNIGVFFVGEFIKIFMTVALLFAIARFSHGLNWWALIFGFVVALKGYLILLIRH